MFQAKINKINSAYNEILRKEFFSNPEFIKYAEKFTGGKSDIHAGFLPTVLKPRFVTDGQEKIMKDSTEIIIACLRKIEEALKNGDKALQKFMGLSDEEITVLNYPRKYNWSLPFIRIDATLVDKVFKVIEINLNYPGGPGVVNELEGKFSALSTMKKLSKLVKIRPHRQVNQALLKTLTQCYKKSGFKNTKPNILILRWSDYDFTLDTDNLALYFAKQGYETKIADPRDVKYDGKNLIVGNFKANLILRWIDLDIFLERQNGCKDFVKAVKEGKIVLMNPLSSGAMAAKTAFAVMTNREFDYLFNKAEIKVLRKYVPWTYLFGNLKVEIKKGQKVNLVNYAKQNKDELVLKPVIGTFGKNVFIGKGISKREWEKVIKQALKGRYILQERVPLLKEEFPIIKDGKLIFEKKNVDVAILMFGEKYFCPVSRCAPGFIINAYQGGVLVLDYIIKD